MKINEKISHLAEAQSSFNDKTGLGNLEQLSIDIIKEALSFLDVKELKELIVSKKFTRLGQEALIKNQKQNLAIFISNITKQVDSIKYLELIRKLEKIHHEILLTDIKEIQKDLNHFFLIKRAELIDLLSDLEFEDIQKLALDPWIQTPVGFTRFIDRLKVSVKTKVHLNFLLYNFSKAEAENNEKEMRTLLEKIQLFFGYYFAASYNVNKILKMAKKIDNERLKLKFLMPVILTLIFSNKNVEKAKEILTPEQLDLYAKKIDKLKKLSNLMGRIKNLEDLPEYVRENQEILKFIAEGIAQADTEMAIKINPLILDNSIFYILATGILKNQIDKLKSLLQVSDPMKEFDLQQDSSKKEHDAALSLLAITCTHLGLIDEARRLQSEITNSDMKVQIDDSWNEYEFMDLNSALDLRKLD